MISASPCISILRHFNYAKVAIPHNLLLKDFVIQDIKYTSDTIYLELLEKNHFLVDKDALQLRNVERQSDSSQYQDRQTLQ